jgi:uncharacterized protein YndB with AHSA1/START domain
MATSDTAIESPVRTLVIERIFDAPRSRVFEMWAKPEYLAHWWGPNGFTLPFCELDFRVGGAYRLCMRSPDGRDLWVQGVYREIVPPERIVFTGPLEEDGRRGETVMTITFADLRGRTKLAVHQTFTIETEGTRGAERGWNTSLDRLAAYLKAA